MNKIILSLLESREFVRDMIKQTPKQTIEYFDLQLRLRNLDKVIRTIQATRKFKQAIRKSNQLKR